MKSRKLDNFNVGSYYKVALEDSELYERVIRITESDGDERYYQTVFGKPIVGRHFHFKSTFAEYLVPCAHKLVVLQDGNKTIAKHYVDDKLVKEEVSKCHPDDAYNFATGTKIAIDRLFEDTGKSTATDQKVYKNENNTFDWNRFLSGEIAAQVTSDTVYNFLSEYDNHNGGFANFDNVFTTMYNIKATTELLMAVSKLGEHDILYVRVENGYIKYQTSPYTDKDAYVWERVFDWDKFENGELCVFLTPKTDTSFLNECERRGYRWKGDYSVITHRPSVKYYYVMACDYCEHKNYIKAEHSDCGKDSVTW